MSWNEGRWFRNGVWEIPRFKNMIHLHAAFEVHTFHAITFVPNESTWVSQTAFRWRQLCLIKGKNQRRYITSLELYRIATSHVSLTTDLLSNEAAVIY